MFRIEMMPAGHGDALLVECGSDVRPLRMLIDGGPWYAYDKIMARLMRIPESERDLELLVVTHVDSDHIDGIIRLLQEPSRPFRFKDIWFNDRRHLEPHVPGLLAGQQGEYLGALLERDRLAWNRAFGGGPVAVNPDGNPQAKKLAEGLLVTVVSPRTEELLALRSHWDGAVRAAGFEPGDREAALRQLEHRARYRPPAVLGRQEDRSAANGSSIAIMIEYCSKRALLAGDAWPSVMVRSLDRMLPEQRAVDVFKLSHHGGWSNISSPLLDRLQSRKYLVSTSGAYYKHPHADTIELILRRQARGAASLYFNYASEFSSPWLDPATQAQLAFTAGLVADIAIDV